MNARKNIASASLQNRVELKHCEEEMRRCCKTIQMILPVRTNQFCDKRDGETSKKCNREIVVLELFSMESGQSGSREVMV